MTEMDVAYFRYMDDILILAPTRWKLKKAIRWLNKMFNELRLEKHPDKTLMGRIEKGFDFLGYRFDPKGVTLASKTIINFIIKSLRLYEQESPHKRTRWLGDYILRWQRWVESGDIPSRPGDIYTIWIDLIPGVLPFEPLPKPNGEHSAGYKQIERCGFGDL